MRFLSYSLLLILPLALIGCDGGLTDLEVENRQAPDRERVLANPSDLEEVAAATFANFFEGTEGWPSKSEAMSVTADVHTASWGNFSMQDHAREPRIEFNNSPSYTYAAHFEDPYFESYTAISNAIDVLLSLEEIGEETIDNELGTGASARARAFSQFNMALSYLYLGASYDRGALIDETEEFEGEEFVPYDEVVEFGLQKMDQVIQIAENNSFTIPATNEWFFNVEVTSDELAALARSLKAKYLTLAARTPEERRNLPVDGYDWQDVYNWVEQGMESTGYTGAFAPVDYPGDPAGFIPVSGADDPRFNTFLWYAQSDEHDDTWARADYRSIGPADTGECEGGDRPSCYDEWSAQMDEDPSAIYPYLMETPDRRIIGGEDFTCGELVERERVGFPEGTCVNEEAGLDFTDTELEHSADGKYMGYRGGAVIDEDAESIRARPFLNGPFPPDRGRWHYSDRAFERFFGYNDSRFGGATAGPMPHTIEAEMDLLKAEAILHGASGDMGEVVDLINKTRVENGELDPAETDDPVGSMEDPQNPIKDEGATIWSMLKHERILETWGTSAGVNFFIKRGWGDLREGTLLHYPIPGDELETLGESIYTFGGPGGDCTIENPTNCIGENGSGADANLINASDRWSDLSNSTSSSRRDGQQH